MLVMLCLYNPEVIKRYKELEKKKGEEKVHACHVLNELNIFIGTFHH